MVWKAYTSLLSVQAIWSQASDLEGLQSIYFVCLQAVQDKLFDNALTDTGYMW